MPSVLRNPVAWAEKAVGSQARFLFLCVASVAFWALIVFGIHLAVRASVLHATEGEPVSTIYRGVWTLVYTGTFFAAVVVPVIYLAGVRGLLIALQSKPKRK